MAFLDWVIPVINQVVGGDASMELTMAAQDDASPWTSSPSTLELSDVSHNHQYPALQGRGYFSELGVVRRKPCPSIPL